MNKIIVYLICLYAFSLPFEYYDPFGISSFFSITKMVGMLYSLVSLAYISVSMKLNRYTLGMAAPLILLFVWVSFLSIVNSEPGLYSNWFELSWFLVLLSFILVSNDLARNWEHINMILITFFCSVVFVGILAQFGIGVESAKGEELLSYDRLYFMGTNPNMASMWAVYAMAIGLYFILFKLSSSFKKLIMVLCMLLFLKFLAMTASRGALALFFLNILIFFFKRIRKSSPIQKVGLMLVSVVGGILTIQYLISIEAVQRRFTENSGEIIEMGGRLKIWTFAIMSFLENPIGYGFTGWEMIAMQEFKYMIGVHNLFIHVLVIGGVVGFLLLLIFFGRIVIQILKSRYSEYFTLVISIFLTVMLDFAKNGGAIDSKINFFFLAVIIVLSMRESKTFKRKSLT